MAPPLEIRHLVYLPEKQSQLWCVCVCVCVANTNTQHAAHMKRIAHTINDNGQEREGSGQGQDRSSVGVAYLSDVCHDVVDFFMA